MIFDRAHENHFIYTGAESFHSLFTASILLVNWVGNLPMGTLK